MSTATEGPREAVLHPGPVMTDGKESDMKRDRMDSNWKQNKANADEQPWDELTNDDQLVNRIRETYGTSDDETECQLTDWQARLK